MSTNSTIAIKLKTGKVMAVYCHWDGYTEHNGKILAESYDVAKTKELMALGDLSILGRDIGEKHDFDADASGWCKAYGRDRGEDGVAAQTFDSAQKMARSYGNSFTYMLDEETGVWKLSTNEGRSWVDLKKAVKKALKSETS